MTITKKERASAFKLEISIKGDGEMTNKKSLTKAFKMVQEKKKINGFSVVPNVFYPDGEDSDLYFFLSAT